MRASNGEAANLGIQHMHALVGARFLLVAAYACGRSSSASALDIWKCPRGVGNLDRCAAVSQLIQRWANQAIRRIPLVGSAPSGAQLGLSQQEQMIVRLLHLRNLLKQGGHMEELCFRPCNTPSSNSLVFEATCSSIAWSDRDHSLCEPPARGMERARWRTSNLKGFRWG